MEEKSCIDNYKGYEASDHEVINNDRLMELPYDAMLSILYFCTMNDIVRTSLISKKMKANLSFGDFSRLIFEDPRAMQGIKFDPKEERPVFMKFVNYVMDRHQGPSIDEFKLVYNLDINYQSDIDYLVGLALSKGAKKLELDLEIRRHLIDRKSGECYYSVSNYYSFSHKSLGFNFKHNLTSLCLKRVSITTEMVDYILNSFKLLENLHIGNAPLISGIKSVSSSSLLQLKHLTVWACHELKYIDITAPKLMSFTYWGGPILLDIRNACLLSKVSISGINFRGDLVAFAFDFLSNYLSQIESLTFELAIRCQCNLGMNHLQFPALPKLKFMALHILGDRDEQRLLRWMHLLDACPLLEKLTLEFRINTIQTLFEKGVVVRNRSQYKCLKTLELINYCRHPIDLELITHVIKNTIVLEEVILAHEAPSLTQLEVLLEELKEILPPDVRFTSMPNRRIV